MEQFLKIAYVILFVWALMTFWPLVVLLLIVLAAFLAYSWWKTRKRMNEAQKVYEEPVFVQRKTNKEIIEAEYTEKEIKHE